MGRQIEIDGWKDNMQRLMIGKIDSDRWLKRQIEIDGQKDR